MVVQRNPKTEKFDIRLSQQEEAVIKQAAALQRTSPTNFIRQQAVVAAESVVHEQTRFVVSDEQWQKIEAELDRPAKVLTNLQKKLSRPDDWDQ
ncbi:MAG: DUF1778 domain-containing protein [Cyanobacteria bacterium SZAS TMP-1]|nr:DUF1778 domain-containing protein [Cyanobacteria bacterium SZAS TMP-1]